MRRTLSLAVLLPILLFFLVPGGLWAQDQVPLDETKKRFFESLKRPQIVTLMETLDNAKQLTDFELGAKYRWGYIPPDRRPPVSVARWWRSKSQRQRSNLRVEWFKKHYDQLPLDRSARELGLRDRLTRIHRELESQLGQKPGELETVKFPGDTPDPSVPSEEDTEYEPVYRQTPDTGEPAGEEHRGSPEAVSNADPGGTGDTNSTARDADDETDSARREGSGGTSETESSVNRSDREQDRGVRYRRVGDRIEVVSPDSGETAARDTVPEPPEPDTETELESSPSPDTISASPNLLLNNTGSGESRVRLPEPSLRGGSSRAPELRRSGEERR